MTPARLKAAVVAERLEWIAQMLAGIRGLPLDSFDLFAADDRNTAAAESYLRRGLEALLDFGRHTLAKGFGQPVSEYRAIAEALEKNGVLDEGEARTLRLLAGYRNRMVHFYHELSRLELYDICVNQLGDLERVRDGLLRWIRSNPDSIDRAL
jgi:uncharacterized protein YutE (UPF0331/DUF86 family)